MTDPTVSASRIQLSLTIPTLNEAGNIGGVIHDLDQLCASHSKSIEVIVVDDDSSDGTADVVRELQATRPWLKLLVRKGDRDLSRAVVEGWRIAAGEWLGCMDGDLQHPVETWREMLEIIDRGDADLLMGSRFKDGAQLKGLSGGRSKVSHTAIGLCQAFLGKALPATTDPMSGLFAVPRARVDLDLLRPMGYKILVEVAVRAGLKRVREVPIEFRHRTAGSSKLSPRIFLLFAWQVLLLALARGRWWMVVGLAAAPALAGIALFCVLR